MDKQLLEEYIAKGFSERKIAREVGKAPVTVHRWLKRHGLCTEFNAFNAGGAKPTLCRCGENDPTKFYGHKKSSCNKCHGKAQRSRWRENKRLAVEYKGGRCEKCGYNRCYAGLDFHHLDPSKKDPHWKKLRCKSLEKIKAEIDKCMLVCKNCHAEIHHGVDND